MTLDELGQAWNDLRNAAIGRSVKPIVKPATAKLIGDAYERWRRWYNSATVGGDLITSVSASPMIELYRKCAALAKAEGVKFIELEQTPMERLTPAPTTTEYLRTMIVAVSVAVSMVAVAVIVGKIVNASQAGRKMAAHNTR
jgi:hypothetical protein